MTIITELIANFFPVYTVPVSCGTSALQALVSNHYFSTLQFTSSVSVSFIIIYYSISIIPQIRPLVHVLSRIGKKLAIF